jgi:uncharacterized membrane protein
MNEVEKQNQKAAVVAVAATAIGVTVIAVGFVCPIVWPIVVAGNVLLGSRNRWGKFKKGWLNL